MGNLDNILNVSEVKIIFETKRKISVFVKNLGTSHCNLPLKQQMVPSWSYLSLGKPFHSFSFLPFLGGSLVMGTLV